HGAKVGKLAGVAEITTDELVVAGLYDPRAPNAADRWAALQLLIERGATVADMQAAQGDFGILASQLALLPPAARLTRAQLLERAGVSPELVERLWRAAGFPDPDPDVPMASENTAGLFQVFGA